MKNLMEIGNKLIEIMQENIERIYNKRYNFDIKNISITESMIPQLQLELTNTENNKTEYLTIQIFKDYKEATVMLLIEELRNLDFNKFIECQNSMKKDIENLLFNKKAGELN